jgi:hypothetical protein
MKKAIHTLFIILMVAVTAFVTVYLFYIGYSYYQTPLEERFYHPNHDWFKPSGVYGHGLGIIGTLMILFGVSIYIARKRYNFMSKYLRLKYLLEFHIFLCTLGPILILYHTAFKFGGIVSIAFWSMVAVVLSGVIGRFIYIQIPRTIEGRELSLNEVKNMQNELSVEMSSSFNLDENTMAFLEEFNDENKENKSLRSVRKMLRAKNIDPKDRRAIIKMLKEEISLSGKIKRLETMQRLFKYWHVAHLPFALIMLIIVIIHVGITLAFGYKWIF